MCRGEAVAVTGGDGVGGVGGWECEGGGLGGRAGMVKRDQRQTLYCHITGPCCILNSTNLSKQSDKILR